MANTEHHCAAQALRRTVLPLALATWASVLSSSALWGQDRLLPAPHPGGRNGSASGDSSGRAPPAREPGDSGLALELLGRLEFKAERTRNERCLSNQISGGSLRCSAPLTPQVDFQFSLRSRGPVSSRVAVDVDYDSRREFDGSNTIGLAYRGGRNEFLQTLEVGNVTLRMPPSRLLSSGLPSGNYGIQLQLGSGDLRVGMVAAQQRGVVVRDEVVLIGGQSRRVVEREIQDYQIEPRRFFFTVDPALFGEPYPNIDILDRGGMDRLAASLPDSLRPARLFLYRVTLGAQPPNPNGPRFTLLEDPAGRSGHIYELLREGVDYYVDPSLLWFVLARPLFLANERLVAAWTLRIGGRDTVIARLGGTPDLEYTPGQPQYAHLIWDPSVTPDDPVFRREIRSVYRLGGDDIDVETLELTVAAGAASTQQKPPELSRTYLEIFGLARATEPGRFDVTNRVWPRYGDPNLLRNGPLLGGEGTPLIGDRFLVFPSLQPFSRDGLARPPLLPNDTIYRTPGEYLYSPQHPQPVYRIHVRYKSLGRSASGAISLASAQIRPGSERLFLEGRELRRGLDYRIDYDLGTVQLLLPDTIAPLAQRLAVQYEENPLFTVVPTSLAGLTAEWRFSRGSLFLALLSQQQRSTFSRPALGYEPQGTLSGVLGASLGWSLPRLSSTLARYLRRADSAAPSSLAVRGELALSRPLGSENQQAYVESFEGDGGINISLADWRWQYSSQPALGRKLAAMVGGSALDTTRASTMAFQNYGVDAAGRPVAFSVRDIDPLVALPPGFVPGLEQILWLSLYPLNVGGIYDPVAGRYRWRIGNTPAGRRWRSIHTVLGVGGSGVDLSRGEQLEFWTLVDTTSSRRARNPVLVFDFGDVSENAIRFAPESLRVSYGDSTWSGKRIEGLDRLDSERDPFSRAFSAEANDLGLPGDVATTLEIIDEGVPIRGHNVRTCRLGMGRLRSLGDAGANCTVGNNRLDEEDIDQDGVLNYTTAQRELEQVRRYIVDLSDSRSYNRIGRCDVTINDVNRSTVPAAPLCWVQVRLPFSSPDDTISGGPLLRRVRALRLTVISGAGAADGQFTLVPLARLRIVGAPWMKRAPSPLAGLGGDAALPQGYVIATMIGTQDRDSLRGVVYEPPPGVSDAPDVQNVPFGVGAVAINERSMRLLAGGLPRYARAEAFFRFPEGAKSFMGYRELRVWARGRGRGWGPFGDLQFFVKVGRDADNFYLYRTSINEGPSRAAWEPEVRVDLTRFQELRARLESAYLEGDTLSGCRGLDSILVAASLRVPASARRLAACDSGYIVMTSDVAVTPPNLAAVQELAVGILRTDSLRGPNPPFPDDTLELWVDDIRLAGVVRQSGAAAMVEGTFNLGDVASVTLRGSRRDGLYRQLGELPSFLDREEAVLSATWRLDKLFPFLSGLAMPVTLVHSGSTTAPRFLSASDILGSAVPGLRSPDSRSTALSLAMSREHSPEVAHPAPLDVGFSLAWRGGSLGSEYSRARSRGLDAALDLALSGAIAGRGGDSGASGAESRHPWRLSLLRISTTYQRGQERSQTFVKPAAARDDLPRSNVSERALLRNQGSFEIRPSPATYLRWEGFIVQDLRDYGGASAELPRFSLGGIDLGFERERLLRTTAGYRPRASWIQPSLELVAQFSILRDPAAQLLVPLLGGDSGATRLPRRFGNSQHAEFGLRFDPRYDAAGGNGLPGWLQAVGVLDLRAGHDQLTAFDGVAADPSLRFQYGLGQLDQFREVAGFIAASAASGTSVGVTHSLQLPWGVALVQRAQRTESRHWARRSVTGVTPMEGEQRTIPDITLRWNGRPLVLGGLFSTVSGSVRLLGTRQALLVPSEPFLTPEVRVSRSRALPITLVAASTRGDLALSASYSRVQRRDSLPGSLTDTRSEELAVDLSRTFQVPRSWNLPGGLRTRITWQEGGTLSYVSNLAAVERRSRLTDNGRRVLTFNAGTDLSGDLSFNLQASRLVAFDRNLNRRFTQTLVSAVLNVRFFAGVLR
jgi:hypothetical protein